MPSTAAFIDSEPKPLTKKEEFGFLPSGEIKDPLLPASWEDSFTATTPLLKAMLRRILQNEADTLEALQQTAVQAIVCRHQFRFQSSLSAWLVAIAVNEARQILRKRSRQRIVASLDVVDYQLQDRRTASPEEIAQQAERQAWVHHAVKQLPSCYQTVVRLCEFEERSVEQTAQLLQMTTAAVKSRRFRARRLLAKYFQQQYGAVYTFL